MKKRYSSTILGSLAVIAFCSLTAQAGTKPNILFIAVDDLRPELGCYDSKWIKSPNINKLAERGMTFNRAYCQVPTCGASRASLLTSLRPTSDRFRNYKTYAENDAPDAMTLPEELKKNGYYCISNGKVFHHHEDTADRSWSEEPWQSSLETRVPLNPEDQKMISRKGRGPVFASADAPDSAYWDGDTADKTIKDIKRMKKMEKPFFIACGFKKPHLPFYAPKKYWDLYDRETIAIASNQDLPKNAPGSLRGSGEIKSYHDRNIKYNSEEWHRGLRHGYYACVSFIDAQVGRILRTLDELELTDNTIIILWGDHGWHLGEHSFWGKHNLMTLALNTPLIIAGPGVSEGQKTDSLVELIDIYPSLCDMAGIPTVNEKVQGKSFKPLLTDPDMQWNKSAYSRWRKAEGVITERYHYVEYYNSRKKNKHVNERMLYDLSKDPGEDINIAGNPENRELVEKLSKMLKDVRESTRH